jgi:hypothetical protein
MVLMRAEEYPSWQAVEDCLKQLHDLHLLGCDQDILQAYFRRLFCNSQACFTASKSSPARAMLHAS